MNWSILNNRVSNEQNNEIYPQVLHFGLDYNFDGSNSIKNIKNSAPLDFTPDLNSIHLDPLTKLTDIISQGYIYTSGLLVSSKLEMILLKFELLPYQSFDAKINFGDKIYDYKWIHFTKNLENAIDFDKSSFIQKNHPENHTHRIRIANIEELVKKRLSLTNNKSGDLIPDEVLFNNISNSYDLFFLHTTTRRIFISQRLKNELIKYDFTGLEILPTESNFTFKADL